MLHVLYEDSIAMELGVEPQLAVDLMTRIKHGNPITQQLQPAQRESTVDRSEPEKTSDQQRGGTGDQKPKAKPKPKTQPKPRGSEMECELMQEDDLPSFVSQWIRKAAAAQGQAASVSAQLEQFESQEQLCGLIRQAGDGLAQSRKELIALHDVNPESVTAVLQKETGSQRVCSDVFLQQYNPCGQLQSQYVKSVQQRRRPLWWPSKSTPRLRTSCGSTI